MNRISFSNLMPLLTRQESASLPTAAKTSPAPAANVGPSKPSKAAFALINGPQPKPTSAVAPSLEKESASRLSFAGVSVGLGDDANALLAAFFAKGLTPKLTPKNQADGLWDRNSFQVTGADGLTLSVAFGADGRVVPNISVT